MRAALLFRQKKVVDVETMTDDFIADVRGVK